MSEGRREQRFTKRVRMTARVGAIRGVAVAMARTRDISEDGVFVEVRLSDPRWVVAVGDILSVKFGLAENVSIEASGMVTRVERDQKRLVRGIGLHFRKLGAWERKTISEFVASSLDS